MNRPIIVLGAGGHAKVLIATLRLQGLEVLGVTDVDSGAKSRPALDVPFIGDDAQIARYTPETIELVNGIGSVEPGPHRSGAFERFRGLGYRFASVIHPSAIVAAGVAIGEGVQLMAGAIVQPGCDIQNNVIINTGATVDHDCTVGQHSHLAPGVTLSGGVNVGEGTHVGTGATVIQGIRIGRGCLVAAGAVVVRNMADGTSVAGVPAREIRK